MPEIVRVIRAGKDPVYEVVKSEDGVTVTIRSAEDHDEKVEFLASMVGTLIDVLQEFR